MNSNRKCEQSTRVIWSIFLSQSEAVTFIIISNDGLESHELHIYICRAVGIFKVRICRKIEQIIRTVNTHVRVYSS